MEENPNGRNEIVYGDGFWKDVDNFPKETQIKLGECLELPAKDAFEPRLHTKPLNSPLSGRFAFRITRD